MKNAIVTGATGMIASALIRELVSRGVGVYALSRPGDGLDPYTFGNPLITPIEADITELPKVKDRINGKCDALYHFAWLGTFGGGRDAVYTQNDNIRFTLDAVRLAADTGCDTFISSGSQAEYGRRSERLSENTPANPETGYGIAKYAAGKLSRLYAHQLGLKHIWARILSVYGPKGNPDSIVMQTLGKLLSGEHCSFTPAEQTWDLLHCDDAALAFYLMGERGVDGRVYPVCSGQERQLADYIRTMRDIAAPGAELGIGELPYPPGQVMCLTGDISALKEDTGFSPRLSFEDGIRNTIDWMKTK